MIQTQITIQRPLAIVWDYFAEPRNWKKWWGGGLKAVTPGWQDGAMLVWEDGPSSRIISCIKQKEVQTQAPFIATTFRFKSLGNDTTLVEIEESPRGGASFNDGGVGRTAQVGKYLASLKQSIERESPDSKTVQSQPEKKQPPVNKTGTSAGMPTIDQATAAFELSANVSLTHNRAISNVAISLDGTLIVSASDDGVVKVWDKAQGTLLMETQTMFSPISALAISPNKEVIVVGGFRKPEPDSGTIEILDAANGKRKAAFDLHQMQVTTDLSLKWF